MLLNKEKLVMIMKNGLGMDRPSPMSLQALGMLCVCVSLSQRSSGLIDCCTVRDQIPYDESFLVFYLFLFHLEFSSRLTLLTW